MFIDAGVAAERIYEDRASGRKDHRPGLDACLKALHRRCAKPRRALRRRARVTPARGIHREGDLFPATLRQGRANDGGGAVSDDPTPMRLIASIGSAVANTQRLSEHFE